MQNISYYNGDTAVFETKDPSKTISEDAYMIFKVPNITIVAVADGHGETYTINNTKIQLGHVASCTALHCAKDEFNKIKNDMFYYDETIFYNFLKELFKKMHEKIKETLLKLGFIKENIDEGYVQCGTTCSICVHIHNYEPNYGNSCIITANVGDSDVLSVPFQGNMDSTKISTSHIPTSKREYDRINNIDYPFPYKPALFKYKTLEFDPVYQRKIQVENHINFDMHGRVKTDYLKTVITKNIDNEISSYIKSPRGPDYIVAMTRALGDFYLHNFGMTCEPNISIDYHSNIFLFVGSDGIWDGIKTRDIPQKIFKYVNANTSFKDTMKKFYDDALQECKTFFNNNIDDITLIALSTVSTNINPNKFKEEIQITPFTDKVINILYPPPVEVPSKGWFSSCIGDDCKNISGGGKIIQDIDYYRYIKYKNKYLKLKKELYKQ